VHLSKLLSAQLPKQALWDCIPEGDLALTLSALADLDDALGVAWDALYLRCEDDSERERIAKLLDTRGRGDAEARAFRAKAQELQRKRMVQGG
jgi:hypothetical protein